MKDGCKALAEITEILRSPDREHIVLRHTQPDGSRGTILLTDAQAQELVDSLSRALAEK